VRKRVVSRSLKKPFYQNGKRKNEAGKELVKRTKMKKMEWLMSVLYEVNAQHHLPLLL